MNIILGIIYSLIAICLLILIPWIGVWAANQRFLFGVVMPYLAFIIFIIGVISRVIGWARSPSPFRITTTAGQQKTFPWIKHSRLDNPSSTIGVIGRMALEILLFRSLFRNTRLEFRGGVRIAYEWEKWLWIAALAFHYSLFVVVIRHLRFFVEPIPFFVLWIEKLDRFLEMGIAPLPGFSVPGILISGFVLLAALLYLFLRRVYVPQTRYISLPSDFFPLFLIMGIGFTGILMRYGGGFMQLLFNVDWLTVPLVNVKALAMGLVTFQPSIPDNVGTIFYIHLFLVCTLISYLPFSKIMHMGGVFLSPTRNLSNNSRSVRHINPLDYPVDVHSYDEYEDEFREKMIEAGLPVERMPDTHPVEAEKE